MEKRQTFPAVGWLEPHGCTGAANVGNVSKMEDDLECFQNSLKVQKPTGNQDFLYIRRKEIGFPMVFLCFSYGFLRISHTSLHWVRSRPGEARSFGFRMATAISSIGLVFDARRQNANGWSLVLLPSGQHTKSYWKLWFIVDLPIKNCDFP